MFEVANIAMKHFISAVLEIQWQKKDAKILMNVNIFLSFVVKLPRNTSILLKPTKTLLYNRVTIQKQNFYRFCYIKK